MRVLRSLEELTEQPAGAAVTIGNFDGVHRGHQRILAAVVEEARRRRGTAVALTFDAHPAKVLTPESVPPLLLTLEQKLGLIEAAGIDLALVLPFTPAFSQLSPRRFIEEVVRGRLGAAVLCVGATFRFGHRQEGDAAMLAELARASGFDLRIIAPVVYRGRTASSTLIRHLISAGEVTRAARLLGRPFALTGDIRAGAGRGRKLNLHTLNIVPEQECLPARGVYITETLLEAGAYLSATNVGVRPTFDASGLMVESHLLDFSRMVRRGRLEVRFHERLRAEKKFPSPQALRQQIGRDVERTRRFFAHQRKRRGHKLGARN
jgi:riboflavin kinase/FMN adenylyltransferase